MPGLRSTTPSYFNSRPYARGDAPQDIFCGLVPGISIHAPTRGATRFGCLKPIHQGNFNSRPYARGDRPSCRRSRTGRTVFQFTPLREGRRFAQGRNFLGTRISIHAPTRGATQRWHSRSPLGKFQFTPLREGRQKSAADRLRAGAYFNSRPYARGDSKIR